MQQYSLQSAWRAGFTITWFSITIIAKRFDHHLAAFALLSLAVLLFLPLPPGILFLVYTGAKVVVHICTKVPAIYMSTQNIKTKKHNKYKTNLPS